MRTIFAILLGAAIITAQSNKPVDAYVFITKYSEMVKVGASVSEVKKIMKNPSFIESGFPDSKEWIIKLFPNFIDRSNFSTWVYRLPITWVNNESYGTIKCFLNQFKVGFDIYEDYRERDSFYVYKDEVIFRSIAKSYETLKDKKMRLVEKISSNVFDFRDKSNSYLFEPFVCIVFEKGTQSVSTVNIFFRIL